MRLKLRQSAFWAPGGWQAVIAAGVLAVMLAPPLPPTFAQSTAGQSVVRHPTDQSTRRAMSSIRDLVADNHSLVTHRRMPQAAALSMNTKVAKAIEEIRNTSQIKGEARMELAQILEQLARGARAVAGLDGEIGSIDGIVLMDEALAQYAHQFDHPGWKAPQEL